MKHLVLSGEMTVLPSTALTRYCSTRVTGICKRGQRRKSTKAVSNSCRHILTFSHGLVLQSSQQILKTSRPASENHPDHLLQQPTTHGDKLLRHPFAYDQRETFYAGVNGLARHRNSHKWSRQSSHHTEWNENEGRFGGQLQDPHKEL